MGRRSREREWKPISRWPPVAGIVLPLVCLAVIAVVLWGTA